MANKKKKKLLPPAEMNEEKFNEVRYWLDMLEERACFETLLPTTENCPPTPPPTPLLQGEDAVLVGGRDTKKAFVTLTFSCSDLCSNEPEAEKTWRRWLDIHRERWPNLDINECFFVSAHDINDVSSLRKHLIQEAWRRERSAPRRCLNRRSCISPHDLRGLPPVTHISHLLQEINALLIATGDGNTRKENAENHALLEYQSLVSCGHVITVPGTDLVITDPMQFSLLVAKTLSPSHLGGVSSASGSTPHFVRESEIHDGLGSVVSFARLWHESKKNTNHSDHLLEEEAKPDYLTFATSDSIQTSETTSDGTHRKEKREEKEAVEVDDDDNPLKTIANLKGEDRLTAARQFILSYWSTPMSFQGYIKRLHTRWWSSDRFESLFHAVLCPGYILSVKKESTWNAIQQASMDGDFKKTLSLLDKKQVFRLTPRSVQLEHVDLDEYNLPVLELDGSPTVLHIQVNRGTRDRLVAAISHSLCSGRKNVRLERGVVSSLEALVCLHLVLRCDSWGSRRGTRFVIPNRFVPLSPQHLSLSWRDTLHHRHALIQQRLRDQQPQQPQQQPQQQGSDPTMTVRDDDGESHREEVTKLFRFCFRNGSPCSPTLLGWVQHALVAMQARLKRYRITRITWPSIYRNQVDLFLPSSAARLLVHFAHHQRWFDVLLTCPNKDVAMEVVPALISSLTLHEPDIVQEVEWEREYSVSQSHASMSHSHYSTVVDPNFPVVQNPDLLESKVEEETTPNKASPATTLNTTTSASTTTSTTTPTTTTDPQRPKMFCVYEVCLECAASQEGVANGKVHLTKHPTRCLEGNALLSPIYTKNSYLGSCGGGSDPGTCSPVWDAHHDVSAKSFPSSVAWVASLCSVVGSGEEVEADPETAAERAGEEKEGQGLQETVEKDIPSTPTINPTENSCPNMTTSRSSI